MHTVNIRMYAHVMIVSKTKQKSYKNIAAVFINQKLEQHKQNFLLIGFLFLCWKIKYNSKVTK